MNTNPVLPNTSQKSTAQKDTDLVYRNCSVDYAKEMGYSSPKDLIGKTDIDLLTDELAIQHLRIESSLILNNKSHVSPFQAHNDTNSGSKLLIRKPKYSADGSLFGLELQIVDRSLMDQSYSDTGNQETGNSIDEAFSHHTMMLDHLTTAKDAVNVKRKPTGADYKHLLDVVPNGVLIFRSASLLYVNRAAASILGYVAPVELLRVGDIGSVVQGNNWSINSDNSQLYVRKYQSQLATRIELQGICKDGQTLVLQAQAQEVNWLGESAVLISFVDNTEHVLSDQMLAESEQRFKSFAEASADFFWEMDEHLLFTYASEGAESALGISVDNILGLSSQDLARNSASENPDENWIEQLDRLLHRQRFSDFNFKWKRPDGDIRVIRYSGIPLFSDDGQFLGYRGSGTDVTGSHHLVETATYYANHDSLTGLVNRREFEKCVTDALSSARKDKQTHALCFLDLDNFKIVNDTCGHQAGDELLRQLSALFKQLVRKSDILARIGGDEFGVLLYNCGVAEAVRLCNQIRSEVEAFKFPWQENSFTIGVSVGVVLLDRRWENLQSVFRAADSACYVAKDSGRNRVVVYHDKETPRSIRQGETHWVDQINTAIADDRIVLSRQKILPLNGDKKQYFEILMRLMTVSGAYVNPKSFLPAAERYGLATKLDEAVFTKTIQWLKMNQQLLDDMGMCSINLSGQSCANDVFVDAMIKILNDSEVPANKICFELTETETISNLSSATQFMSRLRAIGCQFSLDNFGSGLSSFAYLKNLPVDYIKIDGVFVRSILDDSVNYAMVKAINEIGQTLGRKTIATQVENGQLLSSAKKLGINFAQGYHIAQPEIIPV